MLTMYLLAVFVLLTSAISTSSLRSSNATTSPSDTGPGHAQKPTTTTVAPDQTKELSQKELLGSIGVFNRTALSNGKKASDQKGATGDPSSTEKPVDHSHDQKSLLGTFGSFAKPKAKPDKQDTPSTASPKQPEPQACVITDMCKAMNGICNRGTCVHIEKNCEGDMKCDCDLGYTGQFCSIAIVDVPGPTSTAPPKATTTTAFKKANGKQHVNGNIDMTKIVSGDNATSNSMSGGGNDTGNEAGNKGNITNGVGVESKTSKNGSYRKGPEASIIADNSPISLDAINTATHKIKTGNVSIISSTTDTVTLATVSVRNTFLGAVYGQTARFRGSKPKDNKSIGSSRKTDKNIEKPTTEKPTTTTEASHTSKVIVDSSNNITIKSVTKSTIKTHEQTVVKETNGSVDITNKTHIIQSTEAEFPAGRRRNLKPNANTPNNNVPSSQLSNTAADAKISKSSSISEVVSVDTAKRDRQKNRAELSKNSVKKDTVNSVSQNKGDASVSTKDGQSMVAKANDNVSVNESPINDTAGETKYQQSVLSPIIDLLQKTGSSTLLQKALDSKQNGANGNSESTVKRADGVTKSAAADTAVIETTSAESSVQKQTARH